MNSPESIIRDLQALLGSNIEEVEGEIVCEAGPGLKEVKIRGQKFHFIQGEEWISLYYNNELYMPPHEDSKMQAIYLAGVIAATRTLLDGASASTHCQVDVSMFLEVIDDQFKKRGYIRRGNVVLREGGWSRFAKNGGTEGFIELNSGRIRIGRGATSRIPCFTRRVEFEAWLNGYLDGVV